MWRRGQLEVVRATFEIVIVIWNVPVTAMSVWGQPLFLAQLRDQLRSSQASPEFVKAYDELAQRRHEHFANALGLVVDR